jgi:cytochrome c peroxidase
VVGGALHGGRRRGHRLAGVQPRSLTFAALHPLPAEPPPCPVPRSAAPRRALAAVAAAALASALGATLVSAAGRAGGGGWSAAERATLRSLSLASLGPLPADPSNRVADDTLAAALGHRLFFDTRLSGNGAVSCATCHLPDREFQDGVPLAEGVGTTARRTMPVAGTAHGAWLFWDGRADSQWAQALGPLESPVEHGGSRTQYAHEIAARYRADYEAVFGALPRLDGLPRHAGPVADTAWRGAWERIPPTRQQDISRVYANIGKAIAAYERRIGFAPTRFDRYVDAEVAGRPHTPASALNRDEEAGLRLFIGKASCVNCHNGPRSPTTTSTTPVCRWRPRRCRPTAAVRRACARRSRGSSTA